MVRLAYKKSLSMGEAISSVCFSALALCGCHMGLNISRRLSFGRLRVCLSARFLVLQPVSGM